MIDASAAGDDSQSSNRPRGQATHLPGGPGLPVALTPFIGRERELARALELLSRPGVRLLTMTGPGGVGKTRLALQVASTLAPSFPGGVYFVPLTAISDPDLVMPSIVSELVAGGSQDVDLARVIGDERRLLVLDNMEQVVSAAPHIATLLGECPGLTVIVTSQIVLRVQGEQEFPVPSMRVPEPGPGRTWRTPELDDLSGYDAVRLFVERAMAVQPEFELTGDNALAVIDICRRLDGLPLAIELAAARVKVLPPAALVTRLANRLQVLTGGARDQPERLQTMRSAISWSYDLLNEREQALFRRLGVFAGGFTLDAAEALCGGGPDVLDGVTSLVDKSLLARTPGRDGAPRFAMLEMIRELALEELAARGEIDIAQREHAEWCAALMDEAEARLVTVDAGLWLERLDLELDNVRAAATWSIDRGEPDICLRIMTGGQMYWFERSHFRESRATIDRALAIGDGAPSVLRSMALTVAGLLSESLRESERATAYFTDAIEIARLLGERLYVARATFGLADVADNQERVEEAIELFECAAVVFRELGDLPWLSVTLAGLGVQLHRQGRDDEAEQTFAEGLDAARACGFLWGAASSLYSHGRAARDNGQLQRADEMLRECLSLWWQLGDRWRVMRVLIDLADVAAEVGQARRAATLLGASAALHEPIASPIPASYDASRKRALARAEAELSERELAEAWQAGSAMSWEDVLAEATREMASGQPVVTSPGGITLTAREREVLPLLVAGMTDRQIADALFISHRTAQGHVANIMGKLNVTSRTAAASAAIRAGLVAAES